MCLNPEIFIVFLSLEMVTKKNKSINLESVYVKSICPMENDFLAFLETKQNIHIAVFQGSF